MTDSSLKGEYIAQGIGNTVNDDGKKFISVEFKCLLGYRIFLIPPQRYVIPWSHSIRNGILLVLIYL